MSDVVVEAQKVLKAVYQKRYYEANKDRIKKQTKEYALAHPEQTATYKRGYRDVNRDIIRANRKLKKQERQNILNAIKIESGCIDCGYDRDARALDFYHRDHTQKRADVSQMVQAPIADMLAEVAKCDVRCANCHRIKTRERGHGG